MNLTIIIGFIGLVLMAFALWHKDLVIWILDTILWLVWSYLAVNYTNSLTDLSNSYIPTAVGMLGAGLVLLCVYMDIATVIHNRKKRPQPMSYDEEKEIQRQHIYNITRRRPPTF